AVVGVVETHAEGPAIAGEIANLVAEIADAQHRTTYPVLAEESQLVRQERLAANFQKRLGNGLGERPQARGQTSRQDGNREHKVRNGPRAKRLQNRSACALRANRPPASRGAGGSCLRCRT